MKQIYIITDCKWLRTLKTFIYAYFYEGNLDLSIMTNQHLHLTNRHLDRVPKICITQNAIAINISVYHRSGQKSIQPKIAVRACQTTLSEEHMHDTERLLHVKNNNNNK